MSDERGGYKRIQLKDTLLTGTKKETIIKLKLQNPSFTLKKISGICQSSYSYSRKVWSNYVSEQVTIRGGPLSPLSVHGWFFFSQLSPRVYELCPVEPSVNRNCQKVFRGRKVSVVFHRSGQMFVYPFFMGWDEEFKEFLLGWVPDGESHVEAIVKSLREHGRREIAFHTPRVPRKFKIKVKGLGTFKTDSTPYPDGTTEYVMDSGLLNRMDKQEKILSKQVEAIQVFAEAMNEHLLLIAGLREVVKNQGEMIERTNKLIMKFEQFFKRRK